MIAKLKFQIKIWSLELFGFVNLADEMKGGINDRSHMRVKLLIRRLNSHARFSNLWLQHAIYCSFESVMRPNLRSGLECLDTVTDTDKTKNKYIQAGSTGNDSRVEQETNLKSYLGLLAK